MAEPYLWVTPDNPLSLPNISEPYYTNCIVKVAFYFTGAFSAMFAFKSANDGISGTISHIGWGTRTVYISTPVSSHSDILSTSGSIQTIFDDLSSVVTVHSSLDDMCDAVDDGIWIGPVLSYPIIYRMTNVTTTGPNEAAVGDTVTVPLTFPEGYGVVNPSSDVYVTCNGVIVPSTYTEGQLVFTMPDPS